MERLNKKIQEIKNKRRPMKQNITNKQLVLSDSSLAIGRNSKSKSEI